MRKPIPPIAKTCRTCPTVFCGGPHRKYCDACGRQRQREQTNASHRQGPPREVDLTEAQIEQQFAQALAQIRAEKRYSGDMTWQSAWKYREP